MVILADRQVTELAAAAVTHETSPDEEKDDRVDHRDTRERHHRRVELATDEEEHRGGGGEDHDQQADALREVFPDKHLAAAAHGAPPQEAAVVDRVVPRQRDVGLGARGVFDDGSRPTRVDARGEQGIAMAVADQDFHEGIVAALLAVATCAIDCRA